MSNIHPLGAKSVPVEYVVEKIMSEKPKALICLAINEADTVRVLYSSMPFETKLYLLKVADAAMTQELCTGIQKGDPTT